jgi:WhiB family redox-sensing transcriptional regulator
MALHERPGPVAERWQRQHRGACRGADPELFFYPEGERGPARERRQQAAAAICVGCVVRAQCRAYALAVAEPYDVWGGLSESARDAILGRPAAGRAS